MMSLVMSSSGKAVLRCGNGDGFGGSGDGKLGKLQRLSTAAAHGNPLVSLSSTTS